MPAGRNKRPPPEPAYDKQRVTQDLAPYAYLDACGPCVPCVDSGPSRDPQASTLSVATPNTFSQRQSESGPAEPLSDGDVLQAMDMTKLSLEEREQASHDIHGIIQPTEQEEAEDEAFLQEQLAALESKLGNIRKKQAYNTACFFYPKYTKDPELRLLFLRANGFDPGATSRQLVTFFSKKLELFGLSKLGKSITLDDLDEADRASYNRGNCQMFPSDVRDRSGRPVYYQIIRLLGDSTLRSLEKTMFYTAMSGLQELTPAEQRRGVVTIGDLNKTNDKDSVFWDFLIRALGLAKALPIKIAASHVCRDSPHLKSAVSAIQVTMGSPVRVRFRHHSGSDLESMYALGTYGIGADIHPLKKNGELHRERFDALVRNREAKEREVAMLSNNRDEIVPTGHDVLLGRGKPFQCHEGNIRMAEHIKILRSRYTSSSQEEKTRIAKEEVIDELSLAGTRFLKRGDDEISWVLASEDEALEKARQALRRK